MKRDIVAIILAAGRGTRMKSSLPKVLHPLCERPMIEYVFDLVEDLDIKRKILVLSKDNYQQVKKVVKRRFEIALQIEPRGTADAVRSAHSLLKNFKGELLVLYADHPLFKKETVKDLVEHHLKNKPDLTLLVAHVEKPSGYGRILRDKQGNIFKILEEDRLNEYQKQIKEINLGTCCFRKESLFSVLAQIKRNNKKKEYYLTDAVELLYRRKAVIDAVTLSDTNQALGINSYEDLAKANRIMQERIIQKLLSNGVKIVDPQSTFIAYSSQIGEGSVIYPFTIIEKDVKIGKNCFIGPFAHIRRGTIIEDSVVLGNFIEVVRSRIKSNTLAKHFSYLGDAMIGRGVNIGAGTVTANFDGIKKNKTIIKDRAFIGSDTVLIAPVEIGREAKTGAGSVVTKGRRIPSKTTVIGVPARVIKK